MKTGLFNWNKDYASAAFHFDEAVKSYRADKQFDKAIITLNKNVEVNEKLHEFLNTLNLLFKLLFSNWACARNLETIFLIYMENLPNVDVLQILDATKKVLFQKNYFFIQKFQRLQFISNAQIQLKILFNYFVLLRTIGVKSVT